MLTFTADELRTVATSVFRAAGTDAEPTEILVDHLIDANLAGHDSHGVLRIPSYVQSIQRGKIQPNAKPSIIRQTPTAALVDGAWTFGHISALYATRVAISKAKESGVAVVGLVKANHIGRLGTYPTVAAREGVVAMVTLGGLGQQVAPFGGRKAAFGTNPISFGFPAADHPDLLVDFATSAIAGGKVMVARAKHEPVPPGTMLDADGNPTTDPNALWNGGMLLPFGGHKGYALSVLAVLLSRVLVGSTEYADDGSGGGVFLLAIDGGLFRDRASVEREADDVFAGIKAVPPAPGFDSVLIPGEPEAQSAARRSRDGIPVAEDTWAEIVETAKGLGVTLARG